MCKERNLFSLGVAVIARNSSATLRRALESVRPVATQIVVVDTGSTDATPTIATRMGAEVYFHQWTDDFSAARNLALAYLRTEWALVLDTDERLDRESFDQYCHLLTDPTVGGVEVCLVSALGDATYAEHRYTRLFRCHPTIRFEGKVHEQIAGSIRAAGYTIVSSDIRIFHDGYREVSLEKIERNIALLEQELAAQPDSVWHRYHLGLAEFARGNLERARHLLEPICHSPELSLEQQELATIRCAQCALASDDLLCAERLLSFTSADRHREGLRLFVLAGVVAAQHQYHAASTLLQMAPVCQSGLVDQEQRALFAERLVELAKRRSRPFSPDAWEPTAQWRSVFR
ncbi:MAG: glycosyltransferase family 2 protein [Bacteroidota bacterium]|nr:glycosyltransferase family 2 protein [Candidatus Kapabacteria bacterium]MCS7303131.1 glycosyltransferase family 2 protein [Candidatus Kapabacteria bacterium]MCX7937218.1 glycosyltransferase family 2 protein [Chlorobiota bacterium]MDW8075697.1 glycosyltransferase family 2 protein [Bacteroidota bacterium]MDW8272081.1 glycosyltransferase family 2 protein [Bacteroidota bacterium]